MLAPIHGAATFLPMPAFRYSLALSIGIRVYLLSSWCAQQCRDLMWQAGRFAMPTNAMDKDCAEPWDDSHPVVVTIIMLIIISALLVTSAWLMLIGYWAWALFH